MHNLFLGNLAHHIWNILGIDTDAQPPGKEYIKPHTTEEQQEQLDTAISAVKKGSKSSLMHLRRGYIVSLATADNVAPAVMIAKDPHHGDKANNSKSLYVDALIEWYEINPGAKIRCPKVFPSPTIDLSTAWGKKAKRIILHKGILQEVWLDMAKTRIPSWLNCAPANFGSASHGKTKADQWRTVCLINLTTIQLFGLGAVKTNNNHATQHLAECLRSFGPVHAWWAFPFEWFNGMIQKTGTNRQLSGQVELSFMKSFCRGSNLRALLLRDELPEAIQDYQSIAQEYFGTDFRGTLHHNLQAMARSADRFFPVLGKGKIITLPASQYASLISRLNQTSDTICYQPYNQPLEGAHCVHVEPRAETRRVIKLNGDNFTPAWRHVGNSQILLCATPLELEGSLAHATQIQKILVHSCPGLGRSSISETFFVVRLYRELDAAQIPLDPYRIFHALIAQLCIDDLEPEELIVSSTDIISHFTSCSIEIEGLKEQCRVVLSLNRVYIDSL
ncbi:hypothetical protein F4604DRAFT_1877572 [Suillus subluteus]|nr:hypothetical protein F4604DRAFT_1877572 [Suillus subluteus]